jgi:hypothetical protein
VVRRACPPQSPRDSDDVGLALVPIGDPSGNSDIPLPPSRTAVMLPTAGGTLTVTDTRRIPTDPGLVTAGASKLRVIAYVGDHIDEITETNNALLTTANVNVALPVVVGQSAVPRVTRSTSPPW